MFHVLGVLAGILALAADIPYIIDTYRRKTKPHRITWFLFFLLNLVSFFNQLAAGASNSLGLIVGFTIATLIIALLSIKNGVGGIAKEDIIILLVAAIGVILWLVLKSPVISILANILALFVAAIPTLRKSWKEPGSETKITWLVGSLAGLVSLISVGKFDITLLLLPAYSAIIQFITYLILIRKQVALPNI